MTPLEMALVLDEVSYGDWEFHLGFDGEHEDGQPWLQVRWVADDLFIGGPSKQYGRKWRLSEHMTKNELVATALKAVLTAEEHEARERFRYRGKAIFQPHFDVDALAEFAKHRTNLDLRETAERLDEWTQPA